MNRGQVLLVVAALALLSTLEVSINSTLLRASMSTYDSEAGIEAVSVAQAMIDEMLTQAYDSVTVSQLVTNPTKFTSYLKLGADIDSEKTVTAYEREPFKSQVKFNDVDDYNGYSRIVSSPYLGDFTVRDSIYYVSESDQTTYTSTQTWYKKIVVRVSHPNLIYPVMLKSMVVYRKYIPPS